MSSTGIAPHSPNWSNPTGRVFGTSQNIHPLRGDFNGTLSLPPLDGILMANSLHYYREKEKVLRHVRSFL